MVFLFRPKLSPDSLHIGPLAKAPRLRVGLILGSGTLSRLVLIAQEQVRLIFLSHPLKATSTPEPMHNIIKRPFTPSSLGAILTSKHNAKRKRVGTSHRVRAVPDRDGGRVLALAEVYGQVTPPRQQ